jgi:hypothetical protein
MGLLPRDGRQREYCVTEVNMYGAWPGHEHADTYKAETVEAAGPSNFLI